LQQVVDQLVRYPNVYADTSAVRRFNYIVEAVRRAGPRKLLFGTDGPWLYPDLEMYKIKLLKLSPENEALILGGNALRLMQKRRKETDCAGRSQSEAQGFSLRYFLTRILFSRFPKLLLADQR
jgi:hypothetical protein